MNGNSYGRVVVKLSGESMAPYSGSGLDPDHLRSKAKALAELHHLGVQMLVVIGGGNLMRGPQRDLYGMSNEGADVLGMLATGFNAQALANHLDHTENIPADVYGRGPCVAIDRPYLHRDVMDSLDQGRIVVLAGGMGVSGVSTDVAAIKEAAEIGAGCVIMSKFGTNGVYTSDPRRTVGAEHLPTLTATYAIDHRLQVMDTSALVLAREYGIAIHVVAADENNTIIEAAQGDQVGSLIMPI